MKPAQRIGVEVDERKVDALFAEVNQCHLPGAAVGIAIDGKPVYRKGFGLASIELPVLLSPSMRLRLGSTSKHFTCFAYMLLCEEGRAGIDDAVRKYLPELHPVTHNVTMRQLMACTGGLRDVFDVFPQFNDHYTQYGGISQSTTGVDLMPLYETIDDANAAPGTAWIYNNGGWLILTTVIERITGQTLEQVLWERIFKPVGMYDSLVRRVDSDFLPNSATQHVSNPAGGFEKMYWGLDNISGAGAVVSTVDDMLRWLAHMESPKVGNAATWALMKTPQRLANGTTTGYGLGLVLDHYRGVETLHHAGNAFGGNAQMLKVPAVGLDIAIMVNRQDVSAMLLAYRILDVCLSGLRPAKTPWRGPFATGIFRSPTTGRVIRLSVKGEQQMASIGGVDLPAERDDDGVLGLGFAWQDAKQGIALIGDPQRPASIRYTDFGNVDELAREEPVAEGLGRFAGRYRSEGTGTEATIFQSESGPQMRTVGRFGEVVFQLEAIASGIWQARPAKVSRVGFLGGMLCFDADGSLFRFSSFQTWALPFRRCT